MIQYQSPREPPVNVDDESEPEVVEPPVKRQRLPRAAALQKRTSPGEPASTSSSGPSRLSSIRDESPTPPESPSATSSESPRLQRQTQRSSTSSRDQADDADSAHTTPEKIDGRTRISKRLTPEQIEFIRSERAKEKFVSKQSQRLERANSNLADEDRRHAENEAKKRELVLSLTLEWQGHHLPLDVFGQFRQWLEQYSSWFAVAYEKGSTVGLWHAQAVAVFFERSPAAVKGLWKRFSARHGDPPHCKVNICFKEASQKGLSTRFGLLGYVRKDMGEYEGHLLIHSDSVTEEQIRQGDLLYLAMGKSHKTSECCLTANNFIDRAALFFDKKVKNPAMMDLDYVLCQMVHTGKYSIHGSFFTEHGAMYYQRAQAAFCARITPTATTVQDVHTMIFNRRSKRDMMRDDILEKLERDAPGSHDPFASADAHVSLSPNRCESEASASPRGDTQLSATFDPDFESSRDTTEVCTNASATASREPNSMYDISQDFRPDTPSYSARAVEVAENGSVPPVIADPRRPPYFVQRKPGLNFRFIRDPGSDPSADRSHTPDHSTSNHAAASSSASIHDTETEAHLEHVEPSS